MDRVCATGRPRRRRSGGYWSAAYILQSGTPAGGERLPLDADTYLSGGGNEAIAEKRSAARR
jgi:hypothetical protein